MAMPYNKVDSQGIIIDGLDKMRDDDGKIIKVQLKNPARMGTRQHRIILKNAESLKCIIQSASTAAPPSAPPSVSRDVKGDSSRNFWFDFSVKMVSGLHVCYTCAIIVFGVL